MAAGHELLSGKVIEVERTIFLAKSLVFECRMCGHQLDVLQTNFDQVTIPYYCELETGGCGRGPQDTDWTTIEKESEFREVRKIGFRSGRTKYYFFDKDMSLNLKKGSKIQVQPSRVELKSGTKSTYWLEIDWAHIE